MKDRAPHASGLPDYRRIVAHYEACLATHGPTARGVDWPDEGDLARRFEVMLGLLRPHRRPPALLDLGCGPGLLLDHLHATGKADEIAYTGLDLSLPMIEAARARWPRHPFLIRDVLAEPLAAESFDYVVMNGVLTEKREIATPDMRRYAERLIEAAFRLARVGIAFNAMSVCVDWHREDLFYWGFDRLLRFLARRVSRHVVIRADYGLYEFTAYVYRQPSAAAAAGAGAGAASAAR